MSNAKPGAVQKDSCRVCGREIKNEGRFWTHAGTPQPRHKPVPMSVSGHGEMSILGAEEKGPPEL